MSTTEIKKAAIIETITKDIAEREKVAERAMQTLEQMNTSAEDYKRACQQFSLNSFVSGYLRHIKDSVEKSDLKTSENLIRFHSYHQYTKGLLTDDNERALGVGQTAIAIILDGYIERFFES